MKRITCLLVLTVSLCFMPSVLSSREGKTPQIIYIERYSDLAVAEMYRSGIPASITLAQGLLESGYGLSELAVKGNNHFGIKCHSGWNGKKMYHDDDRRGECFRVYDDPQQSYADHSDFLRYRDRYAFLFDYEITDYRSWAHGLKSAGYATDPSYARKLITLIEEYSLYEFDVMKHPSADQHVQIPQSPAQIQQVQPLSEKKREEFSFSLSRQLYSQNGVPFVYAMEGETYESIAASNNLFLREILKYNDADSKTDLLPGTVVYLQPKRKQAAKGLDKHVVEEGESLREISQRFAVRLDRLYRMNGFEEGYVPEEGQIIKLRK